MVKRLSEDCSSVFQVLGTVRLQKTINLVLEVRGGRIIFRNIIFDIGKEEVK